MITAGDTLNSRFSIDTPKNFLVKKDVICLSVCKSVCVSVFFVFCLSVFLSVFLSVCLSLAISFGDCPYLPIISSSHSHGELGCQDLGGFFVELGVELSFLLSKDGDPRSYDPEA